MQDSAVKTAEQLRGTPFVTRRELQEALKDLGEPKEKAHAPTKKR